MSSIEKDEFNEIRNLISPVAPLEDTRLFLQHINQQLKSFSSQPKYDQEYENNRDSEKSLPQPVEHPLKALEISDIPELIVPLTSVTDGSTNPLGFDSNAKQEPPLMLSS